MTEQHTLIPLSPGERLRQARETKGWSLDRVARRLRCSEAVLEAIEADNHTRLAPIYQQGFTRRFAVMQRAFAVNDHDVCSLHRHGKGEVRFPVGPRGHPVDDRQTMPLQPCRQQPHDAGAPVMITRRCVVQADPIEVEMPRALNAAKGVIVSRAKIEQRHLTEPAGKTVAVDKKLLARVAAAVCHRQIHRLVWLA